MYVTLYVPTLFGENPPSFTTIFEVMLPSSWSLATTPSIKFNSVFFSIIVNSSNVKVGNLAFIIFSALSNSTLNNSYAG